MNQLIVLVVVSNVKRVIVVVFVMIELENIGKQKRGEKMNGNEKHYYEKLLFENNKVIFLGKAMTLFTIMVFIPIIIAVLFMIKVLDIKLLMSVITVWGVFCYMIGMNIEMWLK